MEAEQATEALRIQAAAVAAQQMALLEREARLGRDRMALQQHEAQLASHLDEKRERLLELRDQWESKLLRTSSWSPLW